MNGLFLEREQQSIEPIVRSHAIASLLSMQKRGFSLRTIRSEQELETVYRLTYQCYLNEGYCSKSEAGKLIHYPYLDALPETTIFIVEDPDGVVVGTCSTTLDNRHGLHVDEDFKSEADIVRKEQSILASSWRIAVDSRYRTGALVAKLLVEGSIAFWHASSIEVCLMTFNPCHERFYARFMNCLTLARKDDIHGLSNAPAVLMRWDAGRCPFRARFASSNIHTIH